MSEVLTPASVVQVTVTVILTCQVMQSRPIDSLDERIDFLGMPFVDSCVILFILLNVYSYYVLFVFRLIKVHTKTKHYSGHPIEVPVRTCLMTETH